MRRDLDASARGQALHTESVSPQPAAAHQSTYLAKCPNSRPKQQLAQNTQVFYQGQLATRGLLEPPACPETQFFLQNVKTARSHHPVTDVPFSGVLLQQLRALSAHRVWEHQLQDWSSRSSLRNELLGHNARRLLVLRSTMPQCNQCPRFERCAGFPNHTRNGFASDFDAEIDLENVVLQVCGFAHLVLYRRSGTRHHRVACTIRIGLAR